MSAFKSPSHEKSIFLKIRSFFSFKFFQGHNWLTNYPDSEFHGHLKTLTLPSIGPNLSKHWRFLAFWLSLCFGSCLLFLVCHYTAFLFSTHAMTTPGWLIMVLSNLISYWEWKKCRKKGKKEKMYQNTSNLFAYQIISVHIFPSIVRLVWYE